MRIFYYTKRIRELGFLNTLSRIKVRLDKTAYKFYWTNTLRYNFLRTAHPKCPSKLLAKSGVSRDLNKLKQKTFIQNILNSDEFQSSLPQQENVENTFPYIFLKKHPKLISEHIKKHAKTFYQDIKYLDTRIKQNKDVTFDDYNFDIKVPWEISRFQHILNLKNASLFYTQVNNWIDQNPYLLGVNWVCPMDVAIRAINWIYGFYQFNESRFNNSKDIPAEFWEKLICSLYGHAKYLENNWETSDKPNNHYLSDLLGYFYLCLFFDDLKHFQKAKSKTYKKILGQFDHQIQDDGTSYEGSTNYHKLVTEIFHHFYLLCITNNIELPKTFYPKLQKMFLFLEDACDKNNNLVQIGDNDSGKVLGGLRRRRGYGGQANKQIKHYPNFGLSIVKNKSCSNQDWDISFRHPTYTKKQPTGHFHQDELSITLSIDGIPILVDPGTYLYTANAKWRNYFRSTENHNTFYIPELETNLEHLDLFQNPRIEQSDTAKIIETNNSIEIENHCNKYKDFGLTLFRKIKLKNDCLEIRDWIKTTKQQNNICHWSLVFHPKIKLIKDTNNIWKIRYEEKDIAIIESNDPIFRDSSGFYSEKYGMIEKCTKLVAHKEINNTTIASKNLILIKKN